MVVDGDSDSIAEGDEENEPSCSGYRLTVSDIEFDESGYCRLDLLVCERRWTGAGGHSARLEWWMSKRDSQSWILSHDTAEYLRWIVAMVTSK